MVIFNANQVLDDKKYPASGLSVGDWLSWLWSLMSENGYHVFDTFISFADIFVFTIVATLFVIFIRVVLSGE